MSVMIAHTAYFVFREYGFVASSSADWALDLATYPMSVMIACGGLSAAVFGKWTIKVSVGRVRKPRFVENCIFFAFCYLHSVHRIY